MPAAPFVVAVLAGGASRRMGQDKARLILEDGRTLLGRTAHVAREAGADRVLVIGRVRPADWDGPDAAEFVPDPSERTGEGPLDGIATALEAAAGAAVLVVPCDLPRLSSEALRWLQGEAVAAGEAADGAVTVSADGGASPLFAVYRAAFLPRVRACLGAGERSVRRCIERGDFARLAVPEPLRAALADADTPEQFAAALGTDPTARGAR
jgi:Molybdopterin-guanine dinucleotide biosynthesis protein A